MVLGFLPQLFDNQVKSLLSCFASFYSFLRILCSFIILIIALTFVRVFTQIEESLQTLFCQAYLFSCPCILQSIDNFSTYSISYFCILFLLCLHKLLLSDYEIWRAICRTQLLYNFTKVYHGARQTFGICDVVNHIFVLSVCKLRVCCCCKVTCHQKCLG